MARDLGQSFGRTGVLDAPRGDLEGLRGDAVHQGRWRAGYVRFDYRGRHGVLVEHMTPADVHWICERLQRLTDRQWQDAFRAGGYAPEIAERFIRRFKQKIEEGLALATHERPCSRTLAAALLVVVAARWRRRCAGAAAQQARRDPVSRTTRGSRGASAVDVIDEVRHALIRLPLAALLGAALALRPKRRGTPPRQPAVIQTQIILAIVGAVVMLVVGTNLARAFGVVGAAGLVRYRAKVEDPKDAGVMLSTLARRPGLRRRPVRDGGLLGGLHPARAVGHRVVRARGGASCSS